jgi:hypothetical protein
MFDNLNEFKKCIFQYKGGGRDGEFWAWNLCYVDENGIFQDVSSWGFAEIKSQEALIEYLNNDDIVQGNDYFVIDITLKDDENKEGRDNLKEFRDESNPEIITTLYTWLYNNISKDYLLQCSVCYEEKHVDELESAIDLGYYKGDGGIGLTTDVGDVCHSCVSCYTCSECGTFWHLHVDNDLEEDEPLFEQIEWNDVCFECIRDMNKENN